MLFCLTAEYTAQALTAMRDNPTTNRSEATRQLLEAAGGELVSFYGRVNNGPGALVIFDIDPANAPAVLSLAVSSGSIQNAKMERLLTQEEIVATRRKAAELHSAYKQPGQ
jgi:uncharacterized protein with GYD domain